MATMQGMGSLDVRAVVCELQRQLPLWIGKIYQYNQKTLGIRLNGEAGAKHLLLVEAGRRLHFTAALPPAPKNPSGFSMFLRKHIIGGRVLAVRQYGIQRIVTMTLGKRDTEMELVIELFGEGNIILCDADGLIVKPLWHHRFRDREVVPGVVYAVPGGTETDYELAAFQSALAASGRDLVKTLAVELMLGGRYAEEVCLAAGAARDTPAENADAGTVFSAYADLLEAACIGRNPVITASGCWPLLFAGETPVQAYAAYSDALDRFYPQVTSEQEEEQAPKLTGEESIRKRQLEALKRFEEKIADAEAKAAAIYEQYMLIDDIIKTLDRESRRRSWQEIETMLKASGNPVARAIVSVNPAEASVEIDAGMRLTIHVHDGIEANAGRYYDLAKKFRKKREGAIAALERPLKPKDETKKQVRSAKPRWFHRFRWFYTSDGTLVIGGRDAGQNDEIVKKYLEGTDTFLHADVHGGSVVTVKGRTEKMDEALQFAASYSNAWKSGAASADVYAAAPGQVSKTPEAGEYVARGGFIVRGERTYYRNIPLAVAIGIQTEPQAVIGGPPEAVKARTEYYVRLRPGSYEPNDIARKVVRILKDRLPADIAKGMRNILTTDRIAAFVPPGGSDIEEDG